MKKFKNILCIVDLEEAHQPVLERAVKLAQENQASLTTAILAPDIGPSYGAKFENVVVKGCLDELQRRVAPYREQLEIPTKVLVGTPFLEIIREVLRNGHDLVIKAPEEEDWLDRLFTSNDMHLLRKCPCPVWLIKQRSPTPFKRILAAVDVDTDYPSRELEIRHKLNQWVLELAISLASAERAELHVVHAWEAVGETALNRPFLHTPEEEVAAYVLEIRERQARNLDRLVEEVLNGLDPETTENVQMQKYLQKGSPRKVIPALAKLMEIDLIVMGTVARTGIAGFIIGNTAETILNQIDCSVLAIKPPGFVSPVTL